MGAAVASSQSTSAETYTYEGTLDESAEGSSYAADFRFTLFDAPRDGRAVGSSIERRAVAVKGGSFKADLAFGAPGRSTGDLWLQVDVRRPGDGAKFTDLSPRRRFGAVSQWRTQDTQFSPARGAPRAGWQEWEAPAAATAGSAESLFRLDRGFLYSMPPGTAFFPPASFASGGMHADNQSGAAEMLPSATTRRLPMASVDYVSHEQPRDFATGTPLASYAANSRELQTPLSFAPTGFPGIAAGNSGGIQIPAISFNRPAAAPPPNFYNGRVLLDEGGEAWVELPEHFESAHKDPTYHLTAIGKPAPMLHVAQREQGGRFRIAGGSPNMEVSWVVMGSRNDMWTPTSSSVIPAAVATVVRDEERVLHPALFETSRRTLASSRRRGKGPQVAEVMDAN